VEWNIIAAVGFAIGLLSWFGVRPGKIAQVGRQWITPGKVYFLSLALLTAALVSGPHIRRHFVGVPFPWGLIAIFIYCYVVVWQPTVDTYLSPRSVVRRAITAVSRYGFLAVVAYFFIAAPVPRWQLGISVGVGLVGFVLGIAYARLTFRRKYRRRL